MNVKYYRQKASRQPSVVFRLLSRVKSFEEDCWEWTAGVDSAGYATFRVDGRGQSASRVSYRIHKGPIPKGLCVMHSCDNPRCINPAHLSVGTTRENLADMRSKGRQAKGMQLRHSKLNDEAVREIRASPHPPIYLAAVYGVSQSAISLVKSRKSWKHVTDG